MPNKKITKKKTGKKKVSKKKSVEVTPEDPPIPASLQKKGIKSVTDNMPEGSRLNVSAGVFMAFFGPALLDHYSKDKDKGR